VWQPVDNPGKRRGDFCCSERRMGGFIDRAESVYIILGELDHDQIRKILWTSKMTL
jgi:hypothetical protein